MPVCVVAFGLMLDEVRQVLQPLVLLRIVNDRAIFTELTPPPFDLVGAGDVSTTLLLEGPPRSAPRGARSGRGAWARAATSP